MLKPFSLINKVESSLNKRFASLSDSGPFRKESQDITWAAGVEIN
jgi:hypothetical protein